ncbi:TRAP transporter small permease [Tepidamorphus sp. 3E244]|uniref:TRAP transporter small permease n=1 Tax=Tepidamorphus sp. 3E244 TaxID=3385498 RepID=UPI0038FCA3D3
MFDYLDSAVDLVSRLLKYIAAGLLIAVALLITCDVVARGLFNWPIIGVAEVVANGIVIIAYLQLSYAVGIGAMLRSDLLVARLPTKPRIALETVVSMLGVLFFGLIAWASYTPMMRAIATGEFEGHASFQVPTWPVRVVIVACSVLAIINYLTLAYRAIVRGETPYDIAQAAQQTAAAE